jgi:hypothetical protein
MRVVTLLAIAALTLSARVPDPSNCGPWVSQTNGTKWRMCVDQNNDRYCELKAGRTITRFDCP